MLWYAIYNFRLTSKSGQERRGIAMTLTRTINRSLPLTMVNALFLHGCRTRGHGLHRLQLWGWYVLAQMFNLMHHEANYIKGNTVPELWFSSPSIFPCSHPTAESLTSPKQSYLSLLFLLRNPIQIIRWYFPSSPPLPKKRKSHNIFDFLEDEGDTSKTD